MNASSNHGTAGKSLRIAVFANFFKSYMSVSTIVAASIPIPIASWKLIPIYAQQRQFLTVYASLFCFLLLAFVFSLRHWLSVHIFGQTRLRSLVAALPLVLILATLGCILGYHATLDKSLQQLRSLGIRNSTEAILEKTDYSEIPFSLQLSSYYLGIFLFAEAAFVLMAIREYLQDALHLDEGALLRGEPAIMLAAPDPLALASKSFGAEPRKRAREGGLANAENQDGNA